MRFSTIKSIHFTAVFSFLFLGIVLFSCKKDPVNLDLQHEYFGLKENAFVEYKVTYMFHDSLLGKHDTINYFIKTVVADTVLDNLGRVAQKFYRYQRKNISKPWVLKDLWSAIIVDNRAELVEENQRVIKLVFIPTEDKVWDMNAFNGLGVKEVSYSGIGESRSYSGLNFGETVTVEQEDYTTLIDRKRAFEVYAKGVGMVYKVQRDLKYKFGSTKPIKGEEYFYEVINFGVQ